MTRLALTFLVGVFLFVAGGTGDAWAKTISCERYGNLGWLADADKKVRDFFPKSINNPAVFLRDGWDVNGPVGRFWAKSIGQWLRLTILNGGKIIIGTQIPYGEVRYRCNVSKAALQALPGPRRGWLGVFIQEVTEDIAESLGLDDAAGAFVSSVKDGGPADNGGVEAGDVITSFNGTVVTSSRDLPRIVAETPVDKTVPVDIIRNGDKVTLDITLGELEKDNKVTTSESTSPSKALTASQKEADRQRNELAAMKAQQAETSNKITSDTQVPLITITSSSSNGPQGTISGRVSDNAGVGEVRVDGQLIQIDSNGSFTANTYVPEGGVSVVVEAVDVAGLSSSMSVRLDRSASTSTASISFDRLNPLGRKVAQNDNALALIVGVDGYKSTPARAIYADSDAQVFTDYASEKLGIPANRIKTLVNDGAGEREMLLSVKSWLTRSVQQDKTDVYIFFAGHGLASDDGQKMYLLPYDGAPELLEKTAILRKELFSDISSANPRSVTVFLDTCYSGTTRGTDMLIASRPIGIRALEQSIPDNFTVMTAAAGDQTAKPLEEAKHGMFSYFLMKGMEGEADANNDNQITAGELHAYVEQNVVQQSSGSQTPELQGDVSRVLVRFE